ncbi:flagellar export protein FliJ [Chromobacterium subtsugae]|uniref:Flagellar FliJ protein n=1 Tax=Chromobacterium subtsugae TaxID=251747 RepID=A0ABS7FIR4_9NEIS|nr:MULTISPECIES: flagellar export protein FliJ [Chromobacterium]KUM02469.1 flagellar biosynthesis protein FliJ [Chromobacterium subtsugae]KZE87314.1 flagellar biosynthesis protein FliJ [Chromobacterium sp. F49]MBW7568361.1 flagellar export protein FliJ [Chromobacterium subtsugae]MBW8289375.1 flagellar export protein FliJ [Chromobacterium subtsugae]WSE93310.1 flagellar export protein FliJ [Chromobacterium subtsugae]
MSGKYQLLIHLAEERQQAAAERMSLAQNRLNEARARLEQLDAFREEYRQRLVGGGGKGMSIVQYQDFHRFLSRLDEAMIQQQQDLDRCTQRFVMERQAWQMEYKKLKAYEKLLQREQEREAREEARRQQKQTDEFATRQFWDRTHGEDA